MIIESLARLKKELQSKDFDEVVEIAIRLAKHKVENKELLHYLLHERYQEESFIAAVKEEIDDGFDSINEANLYYTKKGLRRVLKFVDKQIKFSGSKETEIQLLIHFCRSMKGLSIRWENHKVLDNLYHRQMTRIEKAMSKLHEDLQYDIRLEMEEL